MSPVLIDGSCSSEEPDDDDDDRDIGHCNAAQKFSKPAAASKQHPGGHFQELNSQQYADVAVDFQRPELTERASGDWETPETEDGRSSNTCTTHTHSLRSRMRNSSSGIPKRIRKETTESFHALSTEAVESDDSDSNSEISLRSSKVSEKVSKIHPALESDEMLYSDEIAEDIGKCFVIAFNSAMQSEMSQDIIDNQVFSYASTAEGKSCRVCTSDCNFPPVLAVEVTTQGSDDSANSKQHLSTPRQDGGDLMLNKFAVESSNSSEAKVYEFSISGGSADDEDVSESYYELEDRQYFINFASTPKTDQQEEESAEERGRIVLEVLGSREEKLSTSSSTGYDEESCIFVVDSKAAAVEGDTSSESDKEGIIEFGVLAEFDTFNDHRRSIQQSAASAENLDTCYNPEDSQDLIFADSDAINSTYMHNLNAATKVDKTQTVIASDVDNYFDFIIAEYDEDTESESSSPASLVVVNSGNRAEPDEGQSEQQLRSQRDSHASTRRTCHNAGIAARQKTDSCAVATPDLELDYVSSSRSSSVESERKVDQPEVKKMWAPWCRNRIEAKN